MDTKKIPGYSEMTTEEKLAALEAFKVPEPDYTGYVKKEQFDKVASEVSSWKQKHNALLSEDERKKAESDEELNRIKGELESMKREKLISDHKSEYIALGFEEALAVETAKALVEGDMATMFANHKKFLEAHDKGIEAKLIKSTPTPPPGGATGTVDYDKAISEAMSRGDMAAVAAYTRERQEKLIK